jgi:hypothetical protein
MGGRPEIRDRVQVVYVGGVEESGKIDGVFTGVHGDLHDPVCNDWNSLFCITSWPPQATPN